MTTAKASDPQLKTNNILVQVPAERFGIEN